jgi:hypothetical protein
MTAINVLLSRLPVAVFFVLALTLHANATTILDTGLIEFTANGTQFGRLTRDGTPSDWSGPKAFPGVTGAPALRSYHSITVNAGPFSFLQIILDDPLAVLFMSAYLNVYNPVNLPPNYGLDVNYLGDPGLTQPFGNPSFFQIVVAPFSNVVIPINEINPGGGAGAPFQLIVEGFYDANYSETPVPEPSSFVLLGSGLLLLTTIYKKRNSIT